MTDELLKKVTVMKRLTLKLKGNQHNEMFDVKHTQETTARFLYEDILFIDLYL